MCVDAGADVRLLRTDIRIYDEYLSNASQYTLRLSVYLQIPCSVKKKRQT